MSSLPVTVSQDSAPLPQRYEAARAAIAECDRIDDCKDWSDKAAALASYARQAKDDSLRVMAVRIQARAERRCGELIRQVPRGDTATRYGQAATDPPVNRTRIANEAGLSDRQRKTALRIANVPVEEFERRVESQSPPSISMLANLGKATATARTVAYEPPEECASLGEFIRFCDRTEPIEFAKRCISVDITALRMSVAKIDRWLDRFVSNLPETT